MTAVCHLRKVIMASSKKKVVVGKEDLRRLMKEKQSSQKGPAKTIDSPLAKYNSLGHLSCVLCNAPIKNGLLWNAHVQGRTHKDNLTRLKVEKEKKEQAFVAPPQPKQLRKRKLNDEDILAISRGEKTLPTKNKKGSNNSLSSDLAHNDISQAKKPRSILKTSATYQEQSGASLSGLGEYSDSDDSHDDDESDSGSGAMNPEKPAVDNSNVNELGLPADFFDPGVVQSSSAGGSTKQAPEPAVMSDKLPEGFFDDPKMDAKVRQVEYKDKQEEEWELFQRVMKEQNQVSEVIAAEDDEEANEERNLVEVEEQLKKWSKIDALAKMKEKLMSHEKDSIHKSNSEDEETLDEHDFEEFLDWRSKKI